MEPVNVGVIGCGHISEVYFNSLKTFGIVRVVACADLIHERAEAKAKAHGIPRACSVDELLADPSIEIVLNLTVPTAHGDVGLAALDAGKCVHNEKPLAVTREKAARMLEVAEQNGLRVGCAPDTFLGGGLQTCRKLIDDGWIGEPVAATVFMMYHGPESFHPDPDFFYQPGGGPLFDMGPYYLTALTMLIGPIGRVTGCACATFSERTITSEPRRGQTIQVNTPTHIAGVLEFANGAIATIVTSFDVWEPYAPWIEVHGTQGSLQVPDANFFGGTVRVRVNGAQEWSEVPLTHGYADGDHRGIGVADMAYGLRSGRPHRTSGALGYHVLDVMHAILESSETARHVHIASSCDRPQSLPLGLTEGVLDP